MPLLDVLQRVPMLSFLPVVLLSFSAILSQQAAAELVSIVSDFHGARRRTLFFYLLSIAEDYPQRAARGRRHVCFTARLRWRVLELPFAAISLIWNSMMSWAGEWFFLMAAEIFTVGHRDFRLAGLGAYLHGGRADRGDVTAIG